MTAADTLRLWLERRAYQRDRIDFELSERPPADSAERRLGQMNVPTSGSCDCAHPDTGALVCDGCDGDWNE